MQYNDINIDKKTGRLIHCPYTKVLWSTLNIFYVIFTRPFSPDTQKAKKFMDKKNGIPITKKNNSKYHWEELIHLLDGGT